MKTRMKKYEFGGFFAISAISLALVLVFLFANVNNWFLRWFIPINNSLWEMGKLLFTSIFLYTIIEYIAFGHRYDNFIFAKTSTLFIAPLIFIASSYLFDVIFGAVYANTHILLFLVAIGLGQYLSYYFMEREYHFRLMNALGVIAVILMLITFLAYSNPTLSFNSPIFKPMGSYEKQLFSK